MGIFRTALFVFLLGNLFAIAFGRYRHIQFLKERREIMKLCSDYTASNELQLSFECAKRMKLSRPGGKHLRSRRFMAVLQRVNRKVNNDIDLKKYELILWRIVRKKLRLIVARTLPLSRFLTRDKYAPYCLIVRAHGKRYGFCTILSLLGPRNYREWGHFHLLHRGRRKRNIKLNDEQQRMISKKAIEAEIEKLRKIVEQKKIISRQNIRREMISVKGNIRGIRNKIRKERGIITLLQKRLEQLKPNSKYLTKRAKNRKKKGAKKNGRKGHKKRRNGNKKSGENYFSKKRKSRPERKSRKERKPRKSSNRRQSRRVRKPRKERKRGKNKSSLRFIVTRTLSKYRQKRFIKYLGKQVQRHKKSIKRLQKKIKKLQYQLRKLRRDYKWNGGKEVRELLSEIKEHEKKLETSARNIFDENCGLFGFRCDRPIEQDAPIVVYLDFFRKPCGDAEMGSLCTQYCCDLGRSDNIFCNSHLECY